MLKNPFIRAIVAGAVVMLETASAHAMEHAGPAATISAAVKLLLDQKQVDPATVEVWRIPTFPDVSVYTQEEPDAGPFVVGALVSGRWLPSKPHAEADGGVWLELSEKALRSRHWRRATTQQRVIIALDWIVNGEPPGITVRTSEKERYPSVWSVGPDISALAWLDGLHETRRGPVAFPAKAATIFRFHEDGRLEIQAPQ